MGQSFEHRVLSWWRRIVRRLAPALAFSFIVGQGLACVKCDYSTKHGICVTNGEVNQPKKSDVAKTIDEAIAFWSEHMDEKDVREAVKWTWIRFYDDLELWVPAPEPVQYRRARGFTSGRWIGVFFHEEPSYILGVLRHELGHVILEYGMGLIHRDVREQERMHHCEFDRLNYEPWADACH